MAKHNTICWTLGWLVVVVTQHFCRIKLAKCKTADHMPPNWVLEQCRPINETPRGGYYLDRFSASLEKQQVGWWNWLVITLHSFAYQRQALERCCWAIAPTMLCNLSLNSLLSDDLELKCVAMCLERFETWDALNCQLATARCTKNPFSK